MTDEAKRSERIKLAIIPVLGIVLYAVLPGGEEPSAARPAELADPAAGQSASSDRAAERQTAWPRYSLKSVLAHNPFVLSDPRAELDRAFLEAGITAPEKMTEVAAAEFEPIETSVERLADEEAFLMALLNSAHAYDADQIPHPAADEPLFPEDTDLTARSVSTPADQDGHAPEATEQIRRAGDLQRLQQRLLQLQRQPVTMLMQSPAGNSALLAGRRISEGEFLEDGIRATRIDRSGVTFEIAEFAGTTEAAAE